MFALFPSFPPSTPSLGVRAVHWFVFLVRCRSLRPHPLVLALACIGLVHHDCRPPVHASERVGSCRGHLYLATGVRAAVSASTRAWQQALPAVPGGVYAMHACRQAGSSPAHFTRGGVAHNTGRAAQTFWSASVVQAHAMHTGAAQGIGVRCGRVSWHMHAIPPRCLGSVAGKRPPPTHPSSTPLPRLSASTLITCPLHSLAVSLSNGGLFHGRFQKSQQGCKHGTRRRRSR